MTKGLTLRFVKRAQRQTVSLYLPCGSAGKESACNVGDLGSIPRLGRSPGEGKGYPFQYSGLENSMDCIIHGVEESDTTERLSLSALLSHSPLIVPLSHSHQLLLLLLELLRSLRDPYPHVCIPRLQLGQPVRLSGAGCVQTHQSRSWFLPLRLGPLARSTMAVTAGGSGCAVDGQELY